MLNITSRLKGLHFGVRQFAVRRIDVSANTRGTISNDVDEALQVFLATKSKKTPLTAFI